MRFNPARAFRAALLILTLTLLGCGQTSAPSLEPTSLSLDEALAQVQAVDLSGLDAETQLQLRKNFSRMLIASGQTRFVSAAPVFGPDDLAVVDNGDGTATFTWTYTNRGDYDQNSEANVADLTPLGRYLNESTGSPEWQAAQVADGDRNGQVNIADLTPLGAGLLRQVEKYNLEVSTNSGIGWNTVQDLGFSAAQLPPGGGFKYFELDINNPVDGAWYRVVSIDGTEQGGASNIVTFGDGIQPITGLSATQGTVDGAVDLSWNANPDATQGYNVWRSDSAAGPYSLLSAASTNSYSDTAVLPTVHWWYKVEGVGDDGAFGMSSAVDGWAMDTVSPSAPQNVAASDGVYLDQIELTWDDVPVAALYHVWRSATSGSGHVEIGQTVDETYFDLVGTGEEYYYYVTTENAQGGISAPSNEDHGFSADLIGDVILTLVTPPAVGSGSAIDPYLVSASTSWQFILEDSVDGDVTLSGIYTLSDIAELSINGDDLVIGNNPALTFNFYGTYNGQDSNAIHFQLDSVGGPPVLELDNLPFQGSGTVGDPYVVAGSTIWDFTLTSPGEGDVTHLATYTVSDIAETWVTGDMFYIDDNPALNFNFFGTYNGQDSNTIYFQLQAGGPPVLTIDNPPPLGSGTFADPYITPPDADFDFTLTDAIDGDVTGSGIFSVSDPSVQISGSTLLVGPTPPPSFNFYGTYNSSDSNLIYFEVSTGPSNLVIYPASIDPNWFDVAGSGSQNDPFQMHTGNPLFNPDEDPVDGICDKQFWLWAEDAGGNQLDNETLEWYYVPFPTPDMVTDINDIGSRGKFHVRLPQEMTEGGYLYASDGVNESNRLYLETWQ